MEGVCSFSLPWVQIPHHLPVLFIILSSTMFSYLFYKRIFMSITTFKPKLYIFMATFHDFNFNSTKYRTFKYISSDPTSLPKLATKEFRKPKAWGSATLLSISVLDVLPFTLDMLDDSTIFKQSDLDFDTLKGIGQADQQFTPIKSSGYPSIVISDINKGS